MIWTALNYYEPLFLPLGLAILFVYSKRQQIAAKFQNAKSGKKSQIHEN
jgi:hypothetical protein